MKKHFNKNLIMTEEEEQFKWSNTFWISEKLIDDDNEKVRDHCHIIGQFRGAAHWCCNLQLTKKVPVIFHNLRGYDSHLVFHELKKIDEKIVVIPNGFEKYMAFILNKNLVFIDSMQFMNSSFEKQKLVKNFLDDDFKYLIQEFGSKTLKLLKQKDAYPYEYIGSFERFSKNKLPDKKCFYISVKDRITEYNGKKLDGHISDEDYFMWNKIWNEFNLKNMGHYHNHYLKKDVLLLAHVFQKFIDTF